MVILQGKAQDKIILTETGTDTCDKPNYCIDAVIEITKNLDFYESAVHSLTLQATVCINDFYYYIIIIIIIIIDVVTSIKSMESMEYIY